MKILFITNTPPIPSWGGSMTFYRHFCERSDFIIGVVTNNSNIEKYHVPYPYLVINRGRIWTRLSQSRFELWAHSWSRLGIYQTIPRNVLDFTKEFNPDVIFTVAGSWSWMAILAKKVAKKLNIPLIGSFNDWWFYNAKYHPLTASYIEKKFKQFYTQCDLALCTSEGMQKALGAHKKSIVLYPTGTTIRNFPEFIPKDKESDNIFIVAFGGSLGDWYGKMLESLIMAADNSGLKFKLFGSNPSWTPAFDEYVKQENMYAGQISFEQLAKEMEKVDGLLLLMGFDEASTIIETTSFKTKFLDYITFQKPILLWGPSYCSAVVIAEEFKSAAVCTSSVASDFIKVIQDVKNDPVKQIELVNNALLMYHERFNPDTIHLKLKSAIQSLKKA
jgi:glycosyltransferase involved in cell wall biosynthesis